MPFGSGSNIKGVAPDASIISVQVFSYALDNEDNVNRAVEPVATSADVLQSLLTIQANTAAGTTHNPQTVNMSLGGGTHTSDCGSISLLK